MKGVTVQKATDEPSPPPGELRQWCQQSLLFCGRQGELTIRVVNTDEMALLNQQFRQKTGPTNVLSFPTRLPKGIEADLLGDIAICANVVNREASEQQKANQAHWAHMIVHGTLHLLGYDHQEQSQAERMEAKEIDILSKLGFTNPYENEEEANE